MYFRNIDHIRLFEEKALKKKLHAIGIFTVLIIVLVLMSGCTSTEIGASQDPIVGHWGGNVEIGNMSLDAYPNSTAIWTIESSLGSMVAPVKWEKNPNGTYTLFTKTPYILTISGDKMTVGDPMFDITIRRDFVYTLPKDKTDE